MKNSFQTKMSYNFTSFIDCPDIQSRLNDEQFILQDPTMKPGHIGTIQTLLDPVNTRGYIQERVDSRNGNKRKVELVYMPRIGTADVVTGSRPSCEGGAVYGETSTEYEIGLTDNISAKWNVPLDDLANRCENNDLYVARMVAAQMRALVRKANTDAITAMDTLAGNFANGVAGPVQTATKAGNVYLVNPAEEIGYQYDLAEGRDNGSPLVIGGGLINKWFRATEANCCATTNVGLDTYVANNPMVHVFDPEVTRILGDEKYFVMAPGAVQMLTWNQYVGNAAAVSNDDSFKAGTLVDPLTGLTFDYTATRDCNLWKFELFLYRKFITLPEDLFRTGDQLNGVNWLFEFQATAS